MTLSDCRGPSSSSTMSRGPLRGSAAVFCASFAPAGIVSVAGMTVSLRHYRKQWVSQEQMTAESGGPRGRGVSLLYALERDEPGGIPGRVAADDEDIIFRQWLDAFPDFRAVADVSDLQF